MAWTIHFLEAEEPLTVYRRSIRSRAARCWRGLEAAVRGRIPMPGIDLVVVGVRGGGIPGLGIAGACYRAGRIDLVIDPADPNTAASIAAGEIERTLAHEFHHALRWRGPGYGSTLGEALVTEGLADHFDCRISGKPPPPWTRRLDAAGLEAVAIRAAAERDEAGYDHGAWFFGTGDLPDGAGYSLGFSIVADYLADHPAVDPVDLAHAPAGPILEHSLRPGLRIAGVPTA